MLIADIPLANPIRTMNAIAVFIAEFCVDVIVIVIYSLAYDRGHLTN